MPNITGGDLSKILAGPCEIFLGTPEASIGHTQDGVEFNYEPDIRERNVDAYGSTPVELLLIGENIEVTTRITQWELAKLKKAMPAGLQGSNYLGLGRTAGFHLAENEAVLMRIHPLEQGAVTDYDVYLWRTVSNAPVAIAFNNEGDRVFEVTFKAMPDESRQEGQLLGKIGSPS